MNDCNKMIHGFINMKKYRNKFIKIYDEICK